MSTTASSPSLHANTHLHSEPSCARRPHYEPPTRSPAATLSVSRPRHPRGSNSRPSSLHQSSSASVPPTPSDVKEGGSDEISKQQARPRMVDVGTQYSPPLDTPFPASATKTPAVNLQRLQLADVDDDWKTKGPHGAGQPTPSVRNSSASMAETQTHLATLESPISRAKRSATDDPKNDHQNHVTSPHLKTDESQQATSKRLRPEVPDTRIMPIKYETCNAHDLAVVISSMLMELIRYNDGIPLRDGHLTRFHSRAPPGISVSDYLQRLTTHATLSPPILLSMVYYIDKLCAMYPAFTISSLTVHRFLITSATVASKGLSDSFWTNKVYARVGGVSLKELALLELEFLSRVDWRIVPKPEVLVDYYRSLIERSDGYVLDTTEQSDSPRNDIPTTD